MYMTAIFSSVNKSICALSRIHVTLQLLQVMLCIVFLSQRNSSHVQYRLCLNSCTLIACTKLDTELTAIEPQGTVFLVPIYTVGTKESSIYLKKELPDSLIFFIFYFFSSESSRFSVIYEGSYVSCV